MSQLFQTQVRSGRLFCFFVVGMALGCSCAGCGKTPSEPQGNQAAKSQVNANDECRPKLSSAVQRIHPKSMAAQTRRETIVNGLNSWLTSCAETELEALNISEANAALLTTSAVRTAGAVRFTENDIVYIRDCLLLKSLTESIWKHTDLMSPSGVATERERVVILFRHLIRNISLLGPEENRVPVGFYETLLTGRGSVEDRIWCFAEALRQRQLDTVIIRAAMPGDPASPDLSKAADLLIGVVVDSELLLFDPLRGAAMPKANDSAPVTTDPAGLEALASDDRWKSASGWIVCHPSAFSPRMLVLQERMEATDSAVLYEELVGGTSEIKPLRDRLTEVVGSLLPASSLSVWNVPEQRIAAAVSLSEEQQQALSLLLRPFDGPFERESLDVGNLIEDPDVNEAELNMQQRMELKLAALEKLAERSDDLFGKPSRRLLMARLDQIMGDFDVGMIQDLQQIRIACLQEKIELLIPVDDTQAQPVPFKLPKSILDVQKSAIGDTLYWTSMTQMSRNDMGAAVATLRNYRRQHPEEKSVFSSLVNEAEALIQLGDLKTAATVLAEANTDANPEQLRVQWLLSRLNSAAP